MNWCEASSWQQCPAQPHSSPALERRNILMHIYRRRTSVNRRMRARRMTRCDCERAPLKPALFRAVAVLSAGRRAAHSPPLALPHCERRFPEPFLRSIRFTVDIIRHYESQSSVPSRWCILELEVISSEADAVVAVYAALSIFHAPEMMRLTIA